MLYKTTGIVLHYFKYSETSIIVKIFTESSGLVTYLVKAAKSKKSKMKPGLFQPLSRLEFVAYHKKKPGLQIIKEIICCHQLSTIPYDIKKSSIAFFVAEVLNKAIREEEQNEALFGFINDSVDLLDKSEGRVSEFHIYFLIGFSKFLGFFPQNNYSADCNYFNLYDGCFQKNIPDHAFFLEQDASKYFNKLIGASFSEICIGGITADIRKELLNKMLDYYRIHLSGFNSLRSVAVLEDVFR